jgi:hypothetical protein
VEREKATGKVWVGRALCLIGLLFCVPVGVLFVSIATGSVGILLGVAGYVLGARRLGLFTVVLCTAAMFLGLLAGQGVLPGSYDEAVNGFKEALQRPFYDD